MNSKLHDICMCCNSHNVIEYYRKSFFNLPILKCNNCLSHFIRFDKKINLENYYNEEYWETFRKNHDGNIENKKIILLKIKHRVLQRTFRILLNLVKMTGVNQSRPFSQYAFFKPYLRGHRLFDLGAGEGTGLKFFEKNGFIVSGLEPSIKNLKIINKKLKNGKCELGTMENNMPEKKNDVIIMSHVLEHVINPALVLSNLKNNLSENGILFIEVPNCEQEKELNDSIHTQPHIYHFTKFGLEKLAENTKYNVLKIEFFNSELNSFLDFIRYGIYWICKKDFFMSSSSQQGNVIRVVLSNEKSDLLK